MPNQLTITAKTGPAEQVTALVITGVTKLVYDLAAQVLFVFVDATFQTYDLNGVGTITTSISNGVYTVTIS